MPVRERRILEKILSIFELRVMKHLTELYFPEAFFKNSRILMTEKFGAGHISRNHNSDQIT